MKRNLPHLGTLLGAAVLCMTLLATVALADEFTSTDYRLLDPVVSPGGYGTSASFQLWGSLGEVGPGTSSSASFGGASGFLTFPFVSTPVINATPSSGSVALSWTASQGYLGWTVGGYSVGQGTASGGPYTYTNVGNVTSSTQGSLTNGTTYYFVIVVNDALGNAIATSTQQSATPASSGGGGGGGGGGSGSAQAIFSGRSYPGSDVTILKDGRVIATTRVGESAAFSVTVRNLVGGTYLFGVYAEDDLGNQSSTIPIPVSITAGATTNINGIFLAPTIDTDKKEVKKGNPIRVFGRSVPDSMITITVNSETELYFQAPSDADGVYAYSFLTTPLEYGDHSTKSNASRTGEISRTSKTVEFVVSDRDVLRSPAPEPAGTCGGRRGDLNCDGRVNLIDFSIDAFWYKKSGFPEKDDLNSDGQINIVDLSIMAANWTG